ncbi:MAG TPA: hypothetical protein VK908_02330 [Jiangellales bacterium]|nr:hypothetical protein [Jiangellales bacterium]
MSDALAFEAVRVRTIRSSYWLAGLALLLGALVALALGLATRNDPVDAALVGVGVTGGSQFSPLPFAAVLVGILGVFATGHEFRHGTVQPTLLALPRRSVVVAAKLVVVALVGAGTAVAGLALNWMVTIASRGEAVALPDVGVLVGYMTFVVLWGVLGAGLALLFRNIPGALVVLLVVPLVVEPLLSALSFVPALSWLRDLVPYLPFSAGTSLVSVIDVGAATEAAGGPATLGRWEGGAIFVGVVAAVSAASWALFERRDA